VLAAAVGVDRAVEADVGTVVAGEDGPGALGGQAGAELLGLRVLQRPAVVEILPLCGLVAAGVVRLGPTPAHGANDGRRSGHVMRIGCSVNKSRTIELHRG